MSIRPVLETAAPSRIWRAPASHLHRAFGFQDPTEADPFLLSMTSAATARPITWRASPGTRTAGSRPSPTFWPERWNMRLPGQPCDLGPGSLQLMTAGRGILHQRCRRAMLWAGCTASIVGQPAQALKMTAPRYQDMPAEALPERHEDDGSSIRVVIG